MVKSCWICKTSGKNSNKSYFRIPKILSHRNSQIFHLSALRTEKWRKVLLLPEEVSDIRICSDHFLSGNPARLLDVNDPDWVPTQNLNPPVKNQKPEPQKLRDRFICRLCMKIIKKKSSVNIFTTDTQLLKNISTVLGHKILPDQNLSNHACQSCIKKIQICSRLIKFFRRNELSALKKQMKLSRQSAVTSKEKVNPVLSNENISLENQKNSALSKDFTLNKDLYDKEQIDSIIEDNSISSVEEVSESKTATECKRRKYDAQAVNIRPCEIKTLKCNNCFKKFDDVNNLKLHKNFCKLFYCQLCKPQIVFNDKIELTNHKKECHSHSLVCHICGKSYSQSYLLKHFKNHFEDRKKCPYCDKILKNVTILMAHVDAIHSDRFSSVCEICGGCFKNLKNHVSTCGGTQNEPDS
ncbi:UNVERIFIED_CONTAM: hypothetical protein PYX00_003992 [Menopon gallinae]|uniref:ZAD domain-containing protein n=1 Tax=Menopon gallinae TaxID=328185 RepID=A0AAW2I307_9NEOP